VRAIWIAVVCACGPPPPPVWPETAQVGCLVVAVTQVAGGPHPMLEWELENVCDRAIPIDLAQARVVAIGPAFGRTMLAPRDPYTVFVPGWLAAGETSIVRIAYSPDVASRDLTIEVELDAFDAVSHRHVVLPATPAPLTARRATVPAATGPAGAP
jgi:hypothetical protein